MRIGKKGIWIILAVFFFLQGCGRPKSFSMGEPIPLGKTMLSVQRAELDTLRGKNVLVVFIKWTGPNSEKDKILRPSLGTKKYFTVLDNSGKDIIFPR